MADSNRFAGDLEGKIAHETAVRDRVACAEPVAILDGASAVVDCGGVRGVVAVFSAGTVAYTPCAEDGTKVTGASGGSFTTETIVTPAPWRWIIVEPTGGNIVVVTV